MSPEAVSVDTVYVSLRSNGDFRMPQYNDADTPDETVGLIYAGSTEFSQVELRQVVDDATRGSTIRRLEDKYVHIDAGFDASHLEFIVDFVVPVLEYAAIQPVVEFIRRRHRLNEVDKLAVTAASITDGEFESVAARVITERYSLAWDQVAASLIERGSDGIAIVGVTVAEPDGRRFEVHVRISADGITEFKTRRVSPPRP